MILKELCIGSIDDVKEKINKLDQINRFETCSNLEVGGLTPQLKTFLFIKQIAANKPQVIMIRNKDTFIIDNKNDLKIMCDQIDIFASLGAKHFIFGYITKDNEIDIDNCKILINQIKKYPNTTYSFHMAIDLVNNYEKSIKELINLGFKRILTKGGNAPAINNLFNLKKLNTLFKDQIEFIVGGSVNSENLNLISSLTDIKQVHGRKIV